MIESWGSRLEYPSLGKIGYSVVRAIASHCKNLRHLKLSFGHMSPYWSIENRWQGLGTKLRNLEIQSNNKLGALGTVSLHCPNVSHLSIYSREQKTVEIEDLCVAFHNKNRL